MIQVLDNNRELREELSIEVNINRSNEKKIRHLERELDQCSRTISLQDTKIIEHEVEIEDLNSQITELRKQLRKALNDNEQKEKDILSREQYLKNLEDKISQLKNRIRELCSRKKSQDLYNQTSEDMATTDLLINIDRGLNRIENHLRGTGTPTQNPVNIIDGIRGSLATVRANYQNLQTNFNNVRRERNDRDTVINRLQDDINAYNAMFSVSTIRIRITSLHFHVVCSSEKEQEISGKSMPISC